MHARLPLQDACSGAEHVALGPSRVALGFLSYLVQTRKHLTGAFALAPRVAGLRKTQHCIMNSAPSNHGEYQRVLFTPLNLDALVEMRLLVNSSALLSWLGASSYDPCRCYECRQQGARSCYRCRGDKDIISHSYIFSSIAALRYACGSNTFQKLAVSQRTQQRPCRTHHAFAPRSALPGLGEMIRSSASQNCAGGTRSGVREIGALSVPRDLEQQQSQT